MAGVSRQQYASDIRLIRVMCSGRVDLEFILRAFAKGQDGVFVGGCRLDECNYVTHGNYDALSNTYLFKKLMGLIGLNPERLSIEFMSGSESNVLVEVVDGFTAKIKELGPVGASDEVDPDALGFKLAAVAKLIPYLKLVERERLRPPAKSEADFQRFWESAETDRLFHDLVAEKLAVSQIMALLGEQPLSTKDISDRLSLNPSDVSKHMNSSSRQGLVKYDPDLNCYSLV